MKVVKDHYARGKVCMRAENLGEGVTLMEDTEILRDVEISAREDIRVEFAVVATIGRR